MIKPLPGATIDWGDPITRGLRNWYLMNEGAGTLVANIVDFKANGLMTNMSQGSISSGWGGSDFGGGIKYDGSNDYVQITNGVELDWIKSSSFTISAWAKPFSSASVIYYDFIDRSYVSSSNFSYGITFYHELGNSRIFMTRNTGATDAPGNSRYAYFDLAPSFINFNHYVWIYDKESTTFQLWVNGIQRSITYGGQPVNSLDIEYTNTGGAEQG